MSDIEFKKRFALLFLPSSLSRIEESYEKLPPMDEIQKEVFIKLFTPLSSIEETIKIVEWVTGRPV